jgi:hypothetical protein
VAGQTLGSDRDTPDGSQLAPCPAERAAQAACTAPTVLLAVIYSSFETEHGYQELLNRRRFLRR